MIFRKFINGEEISFCNVDTPEDALETLLDEYATDYDEIMEHLQETIYGWQAALGKKKSGEPGDFIEIKYFASGKDEVPAELRKANPPFDELRKAYPELFPSPKNRQNKKCPRCKKHALEIAKCDTNLSRDGIRVFLSCGDNCCDYSRTLELSLNDIIGVGKDSKTEAESRAAVARATKKAKP